MKIVQLAPGYRGARQIAAARAEAALRKLGHLPPIEYRQRRGRAWTDEDFDTACFMRLSGKSHQEIANELGRTRQAITKLLGQERPAWTWMAR